ncbi:hypothetical protein ABIA96_003038 [Bradyrhizobium sp. LB11.1]
MATGRNRLAAKAVDKAIAEARDTGKRVELSDGGGLVLRCPPSGVAKWTYAYRSRAKGGMRRVTLGLYGAKAPALSLKLARDARDREEARNGQGEDPKAAQERELVEHRKGVVTFGELCDQYLAHIQAIDPRTGRPRKSSWKNDEGYLNRPKAKFGKRAVGSITRGEIREFLEEIAKTSPSSANRTQSVTLGLSVAFRGQTGDASFLGLRNSCSGCFVNSGDAEVQMLSLSSALVQSMLAVSIESDLPREQALGSLNAEDPLAGLAAPKGISPEDWAKAKIDFYNNIKVDLQPGVINHLLRGDKMHVQGDLPIAREDVEPDLCELECVLLVARSTRTRIVDSVDCHRNFFLRDLETFCLGSARRASSALRPRETFCLTAAALMPSSTAISSEENPAPVSSRHLHISGPITFAASSMRFFASSCFSRSPKVVSSGMVDTKSSASTSEFSPAVSGSSSQKSLQRWRLLC